MTRIEIRVNIRKLNYEKLIIMKQLFRGLESSRDHDYCKVSKTSDIKKKTKKKKTQKCVQIRKV